MNQARANVEKEYSKCETLDHFEILAEEMAEDESTKVRVGSPTTERAAGEKCEAGKSKQEPQRRRSREVMEAMCAWRNVSLPTGPAIGLGLYPRNTGEPL